MTFGTRAGGPAAFMFLAAMLVTACGSTREVEGARTMQLTSSAFAEGRPIPVEHTRLGADVSPPLAWSGAPAGARSYALTCVDRAPVAHGWVHWLVTGIPAETVSLPAGASGSAMPSGSHELANGFGSAGWGGPQPPAGTGAHTYEFTVYALDLAPSEAPADGGVDSVLRAIGDHVLATGVLDGTCER